MRSIQISTAVFAAIWAARLEGEDSEDAILARLLKIQSKRPDPVTEPTGDLSGFSDARYGFFVPEGFQIFRRFKGVEYRAKVNNSKWLLDSTGKSYDTLSDLSFAVGAGSENAWNGWQCRPNDGAPVTIGSLRSPKTIQKRSR
jgi:hypothetical protein